MLTSHCRVNHTPDFPPESVDKAFLSLSNHTSVCGWKGTAYCKLGSVLTYCVCVLCVAKQRWSHNTCTVAAGVAFCHGTTPDYNVEVGSNKLANAAWYYAEPKTAADSIKGRIAFWKGVKVKKKNFVLDKVHG